MPKRDLISIEDLSRADVELLLDTAESFLPVLERDIKKVPTLRGRTIINLFWEASTRTSSSFDLAAKRLSADTLALKSSGSAVEKGETLKDTAITLSAYSPDIIVMRHPTRRRLPDALGQHRGERHQRRRRQAPASHAVPARPLQHAPEPGPRPGRPQGLHHR